MELFSKNTDIRELRCAYWTLCELTLLREDLQLEAELVNEVQFINDTISRNESYFFALDIAPDVLRQSLNNTEWVLNVIDTRYNQVIVPNRTIPWLNQLDQRGLHWVYAQLIPDQSSRFEIDLCLDVDKVIRALDYYLHINNQSIQNKSMYSSNLKVWWERYFNETEKFKWLKHDSFDVYEWGYTYLKKSRYESFPSFITNSEQHEGYLLLSFDLITHQPKGDLLQKAFLKDFRAAFRVKKNRVEKESKNLSTRSYDFPQDTIEKLDSLAEKLNRTKSSIIIDAINILASKTEKDNETK